ncbi:TetR/AcrR family transcriptional regulator [Umezawaea endophytica]|uniref:TetR/AcrR family transcriptional regulator n=1 Tax=Umezawaea endophytica TaxID=1654476 RepID=A0A9X3A652_9PSEU|nr:TetR/AcrR family transcriptional regulator [Umezawaea endophytica]MCS7484424.1 TetR/AcrR family transcriptional regulator [Umezawaea endophytica]
MGIREQKMARTRRLISEKAFELFTCNGYQQTTIEQIAVAAEVGPRTLYRYFPTKETLVVEFVRTSLFDALEELHAQPVAPLPVALNTVIGRVLDVMATDPARVLAVYDISGPNGSVRAQLGDVLWSWRDALAAEVAQRLDDPSDRVTAQLTAALAINVIEVVVRSWVNSGGTADMRTLAAETTALLRDGKIPVPTPDQA